jgi:dihydroxyacid dehydratase/phosphogluconate dehydratase
VDPVGHNEREMLKPTSAIMGAGLKSVALITGRFSGGSHVGHVTPRFDGGGIVGKMVILLLLML